jgi:hypothetical protein
MYLPPRTLYFKEKEKCSSYYQKTFKPEYNIAKEPGAPFSGRKHSEETKKSCRILLKKIDNSGHFKKGQQRPEGTGKPSPFGKQ